MPTMVRTVLAALAFFLLARLRRDNGLAFPRRRFVRNMLLGGVSLAGLQMVGGAVAYAWPLKTGTFGTPVPIDRDQVPEVGASALRHQAGKFYLMNNEEGLLALYWKCPHLGCIIPWIESDGQFTCRCHSSEYNRHGEVIDGPAPRPMDLMAIELDPAGNLVVIPARSASARVFVGSRPHGYDGQTQRCC